MSTPTMLGDLVPPSALVLLLQETIRRTFTTRLGIIAKEQRQLGAARSRLFELIDVDDEEGATIYALSPSLIDRIIDELARNTAQPLATLELADQREPTARAAAWSTLRGLGEWLGQIADQAEEDDGTRYLTAGLRHAAEMLRQNAEVCSVCRMPAHASETDDHGRCSDCIRAAGEDPIYPDPVAAVVLASAGNLGVPRSSYTQEWAAEQRLPLECDRCKLPFDRTGSTKYMSPELAAEAGCKPSGRCPRFLGVQELWSCKGAAVSVLDCAYCQGRACSRHPASSTCQCTAIERHSELTAPPCRQGAPR